LFDSNNRTQQEALVAARIYPPDPAENFSARDAPENIRRRHMSTGQRAVAVAMVEKPAPWFRIEQHSYQRRDIAGRADR
jgi:hypothetical protein